MTFNENTSEEDIEEENEQIEITEPDEELCNDLPSNILSIYERVKNYMISKNTSLTTLCRVNNRNTVLFRKQFLKLQLMRLNIAHPEINPIQSDDEFFNELEK